ncbi:MAG TPA: o-succinylbenzoate synthase [Flavobacterium sp.]|uniref:o-succinylbenzoate synthase n=1 Tax=Flavobacterium sp. TaxID=239 RepID=UPI001B726975|nr:o-succinylbenzoate synthase [Flavobacterium sp.]MBP6146427.1 o-succinylbenzoate synthase [Flavobacterium sp.]MBP7316808.1 o-succinylbenzoate synthase [Flavobacterium sp.]MBP7396683.1 o-succinylbenzoate synthase [Flavobacterium sp.]MBP8888101.1 o-succinylbenzoate synthase [Flavobacterium sp.]HRL71971.1 o-succinylbenzoate synthase [Flavobacterium sp.]
MKATYHKYILNFKRPSGTSRGVMTEKETWFIVLEQDGKKGIGECGILRGLSIDDRPDYEEKLQWTCDNIQLEKDQLWEALLEFPSIQFGVEMAFQSLVSESPFLLFPSDFTNGAKSILINGLVWMGEEAFMKQQIEEKLAQGFTCIKLKIGAIDFDKELQLLRFIREHFTPEQVEIRVDANGAFNEISALDKLTQLSEFKLHSIEQPIQKNNTDSMAELCKITPFPIALDEELIGVFSLAEKEQLLLKIKPQYIILKPSFIGGFRGTQEWISLAKKHKIGWWVTSALESNIGLNAIAQWTFLQHNLMPQGLGTGALFTNNFDCPLQVLQGQLWYKKELDWAFDFNLFK